MNKLKYLIAILLIVLLFIVILRIPSRLTLMKVTNGTEKIGVVPVWMIDSGTEFIKKEEIFVQDKKTIQNIIRIINNGKIDTNIKLDRLPAEYELYFYYKNEKKRIAYYWLDCSNYNLNISGISGEITVNKELDEIVKKIANEKERINISNPYFSN